MIKKLTKESDFLKEQLSLNKSIFTYSPNPFSDSSFALSSSTSDDGKKKRKRRRRSKKNIMKKGTMNTESKTITHNNAEG